MSRLIQSLRLPRRKALAALGLCTLLMAGAPARGEDAKAPNAAALLFETPQLDRTPAGARLTYAYGRKVATSELGPSYDDRIILMVEAPTDTNSATPATQGARNVRVDFFGPERHRAAGPFEGITANPVLMLFLENHVADLSQKLHGNPRYFKNAIRAALRDKAKVEPVTLTLAGKSHEGWRITVSPFADDASKARLRGLDTLAYTFEVAPDLPGEIAGIHVAAKSPEGTLWEEDLSYDPKGS